MRGIARWPLYCSMTVKGKNKQVKWWKPVQPRIRCMLTVYKCRFIWPVIMLWLLKKNRNFHHCSVIHDCSKIRYLITLSLIRYWSGNVKTAYRCYLLTLCTTNLSLEVQVNTVAPVSQSNTIVQNMHKYNTLRRKKRKKIHFL